MGARPQKDGIECIQTDTSNAQNRPSYIIESTSFVSPSRKPARAPGRRCGAWVMDSMPPATTMSASPA